MSDAPSDTAAKRDRDPILIDLALQGGGAHGAFTWGVLDRLLEERRLRKKLPQTKSQTNSIF